jgi:hypothetical protein
MVHNNHISFLCAFSRPPESQPHFAFKLKALLVASSSSSELWLWSFSVTFTCVCFDSSFIIEPVSPDSLLANNSVSSCVACLFLRLLPRIRLRLESFAGLQVDPTFFIQSVAMLVGFKLGSGMTGAISSVYSMLSMVPSILYHL